MTNKRYKSRSRILHIAEEVSLNHKEITTKKTKITICKSVYTIATEWWRELDTTDKKAAGKASSSRSEISEEYLQQEGCVEKGQIEVIRKELGVKSVKLCLEGKEKN